MGNVLMLPPVVLASASPARLQLLRNSGIEPIVRVSYVDEEALTIQSGWTTPTKVAGGLAIAKAKAVAEISDEPDVIIIGCDSVMEFDDGLHGKPGTAEVAIDRLKAMRGGAGYLHTGHCVIYRTGGITREVHAMRDTHVVFHAMSDEEIHAYVETGAPLAVAGSFTLDSLGGPFIKEIHGDPSNVIGLSLPTLRNLFAELGLGWEVVLKQAPSAQ